MQELLDVFAPDCLLLEWPEHRQRAFDAFAAHETPLPCLKGTGKGCVRPKSPAEAGMFRTARQLGVELRAIDRFPKDLPARVGAYGADPDVGQMPDTLVAALLGDWNAEMADTVHDLWSDGVCRTAVMLIGGAHLAADARGGGLSVPEHLAELGVPHWSVVVEEAVPGNAVPRWAFAVVNPPDTGGSWRLSLASADQALFWYTRRIVIHRTDQAKAELTGAARDGAIACLSQATTSGKHERRPGPGWKAWTEDGVGWALEVTDARHTEILQVTSRRTFRGDHGQTWESGCLWADVLGGAP